MSDGLIGKAHCRLPHDCQSHQRCSNAFCFSKAMSLLSSLLCLIMSTTCHIQFSSNRTLLFYSC